MFITSYKLKSWLRWSPVRGFLCSLAVAVGQGSTWRGPRAAFTQGGLVHGLLATTAAAALALPLAMLQLAVGQLSQQDAVGVWGAVPFFRGVGYVRLLISLLTSMHTIVYVALITTYFFYTLSNSIPFWECQYVVVPDDSDVVVTNASDCFDETFLAPVSEKPEYYVAMAMIVAVLSASMPLLLFSPLKFMKRFFYVTGPLVVVLGVTVLSSVGDKRNLSALHTSEDFQSLLTPQAWYGAVVQALFACQTSNGYLILAGDTIYSNTNVEWTALSLVGLNILAGWGGLLFWYALITPGELDTSPIAVLVETYRMAVERELNTVWPLLIFLMLFLSGVITMVTLLYPVYDHCRRVGGLKCLKWRYVAVCWSVVSAGGALGALAGGLSTLSGLEDVALPALIGVATLLEVTAFLFIYGRRTLVEDVEFLIGGSMMRLWTVGWYMVPCAVTALAVWWAAELVSGVEWAEAAGEGAWLAAAAGAGLVLVAAFAAAAVVHQVQYDSIAKLQASFRPSRHWGPRDPITHYYWLARREEMERNLPRTVYRRQLGQFSGNASSINVSQETGKDKGFEKKRSNSDDWIYTVCRRSHLEHIYPQLDFGQKKRSKSLDWAASATLREKRPIAFTLGPEIAVGGVPREINNNVSKTYDNLGEPR